MARTSYRAGALVACALATGCRARSDQPNIVLILTDDLDSATMEALPDLRASLAGAGLSFRQHFVTLSLCCPSRATTLRGQYAHSTGIFGNESPEGGYQVFHDLGDEDETIAVWLRDAGYRTALLGKYLNHYPGNEGKTWVPPGWDTWRVPADGDPYAQYDYTLNEDGKLVEYGAGVEDYLDDVLGRDAREVIDDAHHDGKPLFLYLAPYSPHEPATPPNRYLQDFPDAVAPRDPAWNEDDVSDKPPWLRAYAPMDDKGIAKTDHLYRQRLRSMLAVRDLVNAVVDELQQQGELDRTWIFFTSDNGYHLGQHRLYPGKNSAFDTDLRVPLYVRGPGVAPGSATGLLTANVDLAPTFAELGGAEVPNWVEGRSLVPLLSGEAPADWREALLLEHHGPDALDEGSADGTGTDEPADYGDLQATNSTWIVPIFVGVRTARHTFVLYEDGVEELYDDDADPWQLDNVAASAAPDLTRALHEAALRLNQCRGADCRDAERVDVPEPTPLAPSSTGTSSSP